MALSLRSQRVAVTGATGFIGMHLLRALHAAGAEMVAIVEAGRRVERLDALHFGVERIVLDDISDLPGALRQAAAPHVVHLSAHISMQRSLDAMEKTLSHNLLPTLALLTACTGLATQRVVLMGSCEEYSQTGLPFDTAYAPDPNSPYGASKAALTAYARMFHTSFGLSTVVLRPSVVYGPGQSPRMLIAQVMLALAEGRGIDVTEGRQTRDFLYIDDLVQAILLALITPGVEGQVWNVGSGEVVTVRDCLERIERLTGRFGLIRFGGRPYEPREIYRYELNSQSTYRAFDWRPAVALDDGLRRTWDAMLKQL
jgi:nucleoside-diphosphate-sugar epimerase